MESISEPLPDIILILDAEGRVLKFAPENALAPFVSVGDALGEIYRQRVPALQLDLLRQQIRAARLTRQSTSSVFDLWSGNSTRKFWASFWALENNKVVMIVRDMTQQRQALPSVERRYREMMTLNRLAKIVLSDQDPGTIFPSLSL